MRWGFWRGREIEGWGDGICLLDEWGFFDQPYPRLDTYCWMAPLFRLFKPIRIFHFRLGKHPVELNHPQEPGYVRKNPPILARCV